MVKQETSKSDKKRKKKKRICKDLKCKCCSAEWLFNTQSIQLMKDLNRKLPHQIIRTSCIYTQSNIDLPPSFFLTFGVLFHSYACQFLVKDV